MSEAAKTKVAKVPFKVDVMREDLVDAAIERLGVKGIPKGAPLANKAGLLQIHIREKTDVSDLLECDRCLGASSAEETACPFCGEGDDSAPPAPAPKEEQKLVKVAKKAKQSKPTTEIVKKPEPKTEPAPSTAVTVNEPALIETLDKTVKEIIALNAGVEASKWLLGKKIFEVFEAQTWKLRRDDDGHESYRSFQQFCMAELSIDGSTAYRYMDMSRLFTEEQVKELGPTA